MTLLDEYMAGSTDLTKRVRAMLLTLSEDASWYDHLNDFAAGDQTAIRVPRGVDQTIYEIANRAVANFMPLAISVPAQLSFADGYSRISPDGETLLTDPPEWDVWKRSGFQAKQTTLFKTALKYGVAYLAVDGLAEDEDVRIKLLSTRHTMAFFKDPVNDFVPAAAVTRIPAGLVGEPDTILYYDDTYALELQEKHGDYVVINATEHNLGTCPVIRFPCYIDDEGNTMGVVEELEVPQNRINQTVFDLLLTQTFSSARVRWAAGLQGDPIIDPKTGEPVRDENGFILFQPMQVDQSRMLLTDNPDAKFGSLEETPLDGFIDAFDSAIKTFAVLGSIPPHSLLGSMANLSGETISAAMGQTMRHTHMLKTMWAEAIQEVMKIVRIALGEEVVDDFHDEVRWRDMSDASMSQVADALGKLATQLGVPSEALWSRIPETTATELARMRLLKKSEAAVEDESALDPIASAERETLPLLGESNDSAAIQEPRISSIEGV